MRWEWYVFIGIMLAQMVWLCVKFYPGDIPPKVQLTGFAFNMLVCGLMLGRVYRS